MGLTKLAVIGASHFQLPLIEKAQEMGCEVHAFAWQCGDVGETAADVFHPISITEIDRIVSACREIGVEGVCAIASDLAMVAVSAVAADMGLVANSVECTRVSTDKHDMRKAFAQAGDPSLNSRTIRLRTAESDGADCACDEATIVLTDAELDAFDPVEAGLSYPIIVKPTDRSGSRGVTKIESPDTGVSVAEAVRVAIGHSFSGNAIVEEFAEGDEFSVEGISWEGEHRILAITRKATTGAPHFIETAHMQPAFLSEDVVRKVEDVTVHALDTLGVEYGASHTELKIDERGEIRIIEVGSRMGGDCIGSHMVPLSTGVDFVGAVVDIALGRKPTLEFAPVPASSAARFLFNEEDLRLFERVRTERPDLIRYSLMTADAEAAAREVSDSSTRLGHFVMSASDPRELLAYLPDSMRRAAERA